MFTRKSLPGKPYKLVTVVLANDMWQQLFNIMWLHTKFCEILASAYLRLYDPVGDFYE